MGHKVNPVLFRLGTFSPNLSNWCSSINKASYAHLLYQDLELRHFLTNSLKTRGILLRSCNITRSAYKLVVDLDLFFSYVLASQAKFFWARTLFKTIKKKYSKFSRIKDISRFADVCSEEEATLKKSDRKRYKVTFSNRKRYFFIRRRNFGGKNRIFFKNRVFFFLVLRRPNSSIKRKGASKLFGAIRNLSRTHYKKQYINRLNLNKFNRLFVLQKFYYNFKGFYLRKLSGFGFSNSSVATLLELSKNLSLSIQHFCGVEQVQVNVVSNQLNFMSSFKFFHKKVFRELYRYQRNRDLRKYFVATVESLYFTVRTFGYGNAFLLGQLVVLLLENNRKQVLVAKFLKKGLETLFSQLSINDRAISGVKILIKGRFNKRRRTKKVVIQEGQISLQTINTPLDYYQTQAITIYGSFGIKVWLSKC